MRRHQILTGAVNPGNHCFSVGSIASFTFWAYGSGCDLVILGVNLQPIHVIPGQVKGYKLINCLDCCQFCGKIAVSYGFEVVIYHPKLVRSEKDGVPVFTWVEETTLSLEKSNGQATVLSWASSGDRLLIGCKEIILWGVRKDMTTCKKHKSKLKVHFSIAEDSPEDDGGNSMDHDQMKGGLGEKTVEWEMLWRSTMVENLTEVLFSPDDELFASVSYGDTMIKVWHQRSVLPPELFNSVQPDDSPARTRQSTSYTHPTSNMSPQGDRDVYRSVASNSTTVDFTFTYLIHPKPVVGFSWRKSVPLLPFGTVPNVLISSCRDNMCRVWCETLTPPMDVTKLATAHATAMPRPVHVKKRHAGQIDRAVTVKKSISAPVINHDTEPKSEYRTQDKRAIRLFRHFHIAATINPTSDIPLLPSISAMNSGSGAATGEGDAGRSPVFTVHWLDNKHHHSMAHLNHILHETMSETKDIEQEINVDNEDSGNENLPSQDGIPLTKVSSPVKTPSSSKRPSSFAAKFPVWDSSRPESVHAYLSCLASPVSPEIQSDLGLSLTDNVYELLRRAWLEQSDALFAIHPSDGSLLVWHISYLDENRCGQVRQAQVSFSSRIPMAIPACDASTLCSRLVLYANHYSTHLAFNGATTNPPSSPQKTTGSAPQETPESGSSNGHPNPTVSVLSKHSDGSLNQWEIAFSPTTGYSTVTSITHTSRFCGHRYHLSGIFCHPTLPLLLTTSHHQLDQLDLNQSEDTGSEEGVGNDWGQKVRSELILWRVDPVGTLCHAGGVTELARMNGPAIEDFKKVAWFPVLFPSWCLGASNTSPSTCFLSMHGTCLRIYQAVIDAEQLLEDLEASGESGYADHDVVGRVASQQSSSQPGCLLLLDTIQLDSDIDEGEILLLTVFPENQFLQESDAPPGVNAKSSDRKRATKKGHGIAEAFLVILVQKNGPGAMVKTWKVSFSANLTSVTGARTRRSTSVIPSDSSENASGSDYDTENISESEKQRLSFLNVSSVLVDSQILKHPHNAGISLACGASDPFSLCVFHHIQILPFAIVTTDVTGEVFFWRGTKKWNHNYNLGPAQIESLEWMPWDTTGCSSAGLASPQIEFDGVPLVVKMAHCCMLACLSEVRSGRRSLCYVSVYECISSGGSVWRLQDKLLVGNLDRGPLGRADKNITDSAHLDWLSREDGTFLLTVNVGRKVRIYTQSPIGMQWEEMSSSNVTEEEDTSQDSRTHTTRPLLKRQSTLDIVTRQKLMGPYALRSKDHDTSKDRSKCHPECNHLLHWSLLSEISLGNSVGLSAVHLENLVTPKPRPVMVSWVRDGLLLVATETEMHVFCHWMEQQSTENKQSATSGVLYGSASLSHSKPEGLCQYMMQEPDMFGDSQLTTGTPVVSLMSVADLLCPCLPQYHPLVLSELTNGGHLNTVKHILINLARMMNGQLDSQESVVHVQPLRLQKFGLTTDDDDSTQKKQIAPLLLYDLLDEDGHINDSMARSHLDPENTSKSRTASTSRPVDIQEKGSYEDLFSSSIPDEEEEINFLIDKKQENTPEDIIDLTEFEPGYLGPEHCQVMHNYLSRNLLPGMSSLDQMELMAIADTVASAVDTAAVQISDEKVAGDISGGGRGYAASGHTATESMDQCGMRFVFAMHNHLCLLRSLPAQQRSKLLRQGLGSCNFAWGFHSDAEEEVLSLISSVQRGAPEWQELKSFGAGWWVRSTPTLRRLIEQIARTAFQRESNPLDAAIFYMALNKKNVLKGLFKSVHDDRMTQFFSQNFKDERWHRAALKNAFALMGKQRFQEAAAFFLLADSVQDAVEVCIDKMRDLQLASIIVRLYNQDTAASHADFLRKHVLGESEVTVKKIHPDPFVRSMAYWTLGSYEDALKTLLENHRSADDSRQDIPASITDIFNFYNYLRTHPLIMRQKKIDQSCNVGSAEDQLDDSISLEERMLFFATASSHLDAGCPLLTLDVLSSLPPLSQDLHGNSDSNEDQISLSEKSSFPTDDDFSTRAASNASALFDDPTDWGEPTSIEPILESGGCDDLELEWSQSEDESDEDKVEDRPRLHVSAPTPVKAVTNIEKPQKLGAKKKPKIQQLDIYAHQLRLMACLKIFVSELKSLATTYHSDDGQIRDQLYAWLEKETAVLHRISPVSDIKSPIVKPFSKVLQNNMDEDQRSEFSSGSESDGEPRRSFSRRTGDEMSLSPAGGSLHPVPSLHELYLAEKQDWKLRREMASHRRRWLRQYRRFLRTLLSYCCLHDDTHGTLSPLRMELLLLLQDSLQERTPQQLSSPLPNPTSIPLLSSSVVACRTVVAEPTSRLTHMARDILSTLLSLSEPPPYSRLNTQSATSILCRQAEALSSCMYQSLCDTNSRTYRARLLEGDRVNTPDTYPGLAPSSSASDTQYVPPSTHPAQWPGVSSLLALLNSDSGDTRPRLIVLLCESLVAIYVSLLVHGLQTTNSLLLYRLVTHSLCEKTWNAVFGGGARVIVKYAKPVTAASPSRRMDGSKARDKLNLRVLSYSLERRTSFSSANSVDNTSYREKFVAPETTLWDFLLSKPLVSFSGSDEVGFDSDDDMQSDDSIDGFSEEENWDEFGETKADIDRKATEHGDPTSYSWHILRLAVVRTVLHNLKTFLPTTGLELSELGTSSPMLNSILQLLAQWQLTLAQALESFGDPPAEYIKGIQGTAGVPKGRPAILKYQAMLNPSNTPFNGSSTECLGARRLWHCLVRRENLQDMFIRFIFQKKAAKEKAEQTLADRRASIAIEKSSIGGQVHSGMKKKLNEGSKSMETRRATIAVMSLHNHSTIQHSRSGNLKSRMGHIDPHLGKVKILHKETEIISSFCINYASPNYVVLSTNRDVQEIDVSSVLASDSWSWIEEDISSPSLLQHAEDAGKSSSHKDEDFLVVTRKQPLFAGTVNQNASSPTMPWTGATQTGQGASVLLKRSFSGVRRMTSHPSLPYYLTGHHDGSIRMWEWGHQQQISLFRAAGQFPKVTNLHFSSLGNKIAATDADGYLALWQVSSPKKPFLYHQCHDRSATDCCFLSSTSVLATTGLATTNRNVAIWDTLLPPRSMLVKDFLAHEGVGATCISYATQHRTLVVGGRDGKVSVFDLRRHDDPLHCFVAHEAPVKCVDTSLDEGLFVTGSIVGDMRVWDMQSHLLAYNLSGEHARTSIFRNFGSGTMKAQIVAPGNRVFSCGADGTLKLRVLPNDPGDDLGGNHSLGGRIQKLALQRQVVKLADAIRQQCLAY